MKQLKSKLEEKYLKTKEFVKENKKILILGGTVGVLSGLIYGVTKARENNDWVYDEELDDFVKLPSSEQKIF